MRLLRESFPGSRWELMPLKVRKKGMDGHGTVLVCHVHLLNNSTAGGSRFVCGTISVYRNVGVEASVVSVTWGSLRYRCKITSILVNIV